MTKNKTKYIQVLKCLSLFGFLCLLSSYSFGQYKQIRGKVTDQYDNPIEGVKITNNRNYPLGETNSKGEFVFNYQIPMRGSLPTFNFDKEGYEPTYWIYDKEDHKHIVVHKIIEIEYVEITGQIKGIDGEGIPNVKIYSKSHNISGNYSSTYSNGKGYFDFSYPSNLDSPIKIKFFKKGYKSVYWTYEGEDRIEITMEKRPPKPEN